MGCGDGRQEGGRKGRGRCVLGVGVKEAGAGGGW